MRRRTLVVDARSAYQLAVYRAAIRADHGLRVVTLPELVARLAGPHLRIAGAADVQYALRDLDVAVLPELGRIADLPGFPRAASRTLGRTWHAGLVLLDLRDRGGRWLELARLEAHVRHRLPVGVLTPVAAAARASTRVYHAAAILGDVTLSRLDAVPPVYRALIADLTRAVPVRFEGRRNAPPHPLPEGVSFHPAAVAHADADPGREPRRTRVLCATTEAEALEALRWARRLIAEGCVPPGDIAIVAADTRPYEDALLAAAAESDLPVYAASGVPSRDTAAGQAAAALAEAIVRGLDRERLERFVHTALRSRNGSAEVQRLAAEWNPALPRNAPLATLDRFQRALARADVSDATRGVLLELAEAIDRGPAAAAQTAERYLTGGALAAFQAALRLGPAEALPANLADLRGPDTSEHPAGAVLFASAAEAAAAPRQHLRLLGLAARAWPRGEREDPLAPDALLSAAGLPPDALRPRPVNAADEDAFAALLAAATGEVVLSRPERSGDGGLLAPSPLLRSAGVPDDQEVRSGPVRHAYSESDRRAVRPSEAGGDPVARAAAAAWTSRAGDGYGPHDGSVRANHPALMRALARVHSATSLSKLLLDPLGFVWSYALGWTEPEDKAPDLGLDAASRGSLLHDALRRAVVRLDAGSGLADASEDERQEAIRSATQDACDHWETTGPVPPGLMWRAERVRIAELARTALRITPHPWPGGASYAEAPFGRDQRREGGHVARASGQAADPRPWPPHASVLLPGSDLRLTGTIDRLDLAPDRRAAQVVDYKSGTYRPAMDLKLDLDGGGELQRVLYACAARAALPDLKEVLALLAYPVSETVRPLAPEHEQEALQGLVAAVQAAAAAIRAGTLAPGPAAAADYNRQRLAHPADLTRGYLTRKAPQFEPLLAPMRAILEAAAEDGGAA